MIAPIAVRELLVASRRSLSWRIRLLMTLCALLIASLALVSVRSASAVGIEIFNVLCFISFLYALSAGILFTADSITAERREGTFGLLYLTPLSSWNVVSGKLLSTSLQGIYGLVATVPVLSLSLLGGGVTGELVLRMVSLLLATLLLSLSAGIFASASARSRSAAVGLTLLLTLGALAGGWVGIMIASVIAFVSEQEVKQRANVYWFMAYGTLVAFLIWMVKVSGYGLVGSPGQVYYAAYQSSNFAFAASVAAIGATALFYLFSAPLCTEWFRTARQISPQEDDSEHQLDDVFFPGLRIKGWVGNDPANWLLEFLQAPPVLFYIILGLMLLVTLGQGGSPSGLGSSYIFAFIGILPYLAFNFTVARYCAAPFRLLERSGFMETLLTTPLRLENLARAQRRIFWRTLRLPMLFLILASIPAFLNLLSRAPLNSEPVTASVVLFTVHWGIGWLIFLLHLEVLALVAMSRAVQGRTPLNAALWATATVMVPVFAINFLAAALGVLVGKGGMSGYFVAQLLGYVVLALFFIFLLRRTRARLGLRPNLFKP